MEVVEQIQDLKSHPRDEEDGEILEDGEIDEEDVNDVSVMEQVETETVVEEVVLNGEEEEVVSEDEEEQRKHRKRSHHRRRKRRHEDHKLEDKKSRKKRKGDDGSEGNESPPSKRKKKRKKHSRDKRESSSPDVEALEDSRLSESPPLPSEQNPYTYSAYNSMDSYTGTDQYVASYDPTTPYTDPNNMSSYSYDTYTNEPDYSSGSDSCYSDFESHLKQYQNYKQNKNADDAGSNENDDDDNYYSVGYDAEQRRKRRQDNQRTNKKQSQKVRGNSESHSRRKRGGRKYPEVCQHYLNGFCQQGDKCNYMHEEYPCKYFHTGMQCHSGESCRFSHEPVNPDTEKIIKQLRDAFNNMDDSKEIEALEKAGLKPLQKPPPGMGLLPTPAGSMTMHSANKTHTNSNKSAKSSIPSLFDITVQPTRELQQKIEANSVASLKMIDDVISDPTASMPAPMFDPNTPGAGLLPLPSLPNPLLRPPLIPNFPPPSLLGTPPGPPVLLPTPPVPRIPPPILPPGSATPPWILRQQALLKQEQEEAKAKEYYEKLYSQPSNPPPETMQSDMSGPNHQSLPMETNTNKDSDKNHMMHGDRHDNHEEAKHETEEDVIRINDDGTIKVKAPQAPDFLPAKQKSLFMRIQQKGDLPEGRRKPNDRWDATRANSADNWTYSSDEDDTVRNSVRKSSDSTESVQSIIQIISNKKSDKSSVVDTNLLSKVANVISMSPSASVSHDQTSGKAMMSPSHKPQQRTKERKSSGSDVSPSHHHPSRDHPLRRRLSTSELYKEPLTIPLVTKQNSDTMRVAHPDPRVSLSRLFGKLKTEFRGSKPIFGKDVMIPGAGKMTGLKITLSSNDSSKLDANGDKRIDPRLSLQQGRNRSGDPRMKNKLNDPRLRVRASSTSKTSPPRLSVITSSKSAVPPTPTALLTRPSSSIIPSLPELNLDLANVPEAKHIVSPISPAITKPGDPLARLPRLLRGNIRPVSARLMPTTNAQDAPKPSAAPTIAPYDPRYINAGASPTTGAPKTKTTAALSTNPAPYDPRVLSSQSSNAPPLFDARSPGQEITKRAIPLPKLTPAPGYAAKLQETNGSSHELPTGEAVDF